MGLFNYIKSSFKDNYDLDDIDEFVYDDEVEEEKEQKQKEMSGLVSELEKNYEKHENDMQLENDRKRPKHMQNRTKQRRIKAKEEEAKYDQLLNSMQAKTLIHEVDKLNKNAAGEEKISGKLAKEEQIEEENIKALEEKARKQEVYRALNPEMTKDELDEKTEEQQYESAAVEIPDVTRTPRKLENVDTELYEKYDKAAVTDYIKNQCEIMEEATGHIETAMEEYNSVTEHFTDIQLIETAPSDMRQRILQEADRVDNLTVDRRIFKSGERKLSNNTYNRLEQYQEELPRAIKYLEKQESYYETVKRDMRMLEGERLSLRMEAKTLAKRQLHIRSFGLLAMVGLVIVFFVFFVALALTDDTQNTMLYMAVVFLGAVLAMGMFALLKYTERQVLITEIKINKAASILNKTKIKYINAANTLDYEYNKYHVKSSFELSKKYEVFLDMKNEQRKVVQITTRLNEAEKDLLSDLRKLGLHDARIWLSQVKALLHNKEMAEFRHELNAQRQKLRKQIEYNESRIEEAKNNILQTTKEHPECMKEAMEVLGQFENTMKA